MNQNGGDPDQEWLSAVPQSEGPHREQSAGLLDNLADFSFGSSALGIDVRQPSSFVATESLVSPYFTHPETPGQGRPLLSSPRSITSPPLNRRTSSHQHGGDAAGAMGTNENDNDQPRPPPPQVKLASEKADCLAMPDTKSNPFRGQDVPLDNPQPPEMHAYGPEPSFSPTGTYYANGTPNQSRQDFGDADFMGSYNQQVSRYCLSNGDVESSASEFWPIIVLILSVYSTCASLAWLVIAALQPTWHFVGSRPGSLEPPNATLVTALIAKTIEMSFVTVFVTFLGQVLSRRALSGREKGVTLAELTLRDIVIQPGTLLTPNHSIRYAAGTILGLLALLATVGATFYTTASDAMVSPKLSFGSWSQSTLYGRIRSQYSNPGYAREICKTPIRQLDSAELAGSNCLDVQFSGNSYHNLMEFMAAWELVNSNGTALTQDLALRPHGTASLFPNTTMVSAWIDTGKSNITKNFETYGRIVNEVTLAMPHPGVYFAATDPVNGIPQPKDLTGVGEYSVRASVVSPTVNVKCVDMSKDDLAPLIYTEWPNALTNDTGVGTQKIGYPGWISDVPPLTETEYYNRTVVDDIFKWGEKYKRRPPVFRMFPADFNVITNSTPAAWQLTAMYVLGKNPLTPNYTLCELQSSLTPKCSTQFDMSGTKGARMVAHCEDDRDEDAYYRKNKVDANDTASWGPRGDWRNFVDQLRLALNLDGGVQNDNASNARLLTQLAVTGAAGGTGPPHMPYLLPSMAEALAVLVSSTLVMGSIDTPFGPSWEYAKPALGPNGTPQAFVASVQQQGYKSTHADAWQGIFYVVLAIVVVVNLVCLGFFIFSWGMRLTTDYSQPANLFSLALMSPPNHQLRGYCGTGAHDRAFAVPWRVVGTPERGDFDVDELCRSDSRGGGGGGQPGGDGINPKQMEAAGFSNGGGYLAQHHFGNGYEPLHFYFRPAGNPVRGKWKGTEYGESPHLSSPRSVSSYQRLSNRKSWL